MKSFPTYILCILAFAILPLSGNAQKDDKPPKDYWECSYPGCDSSPYGSDFIFKAFFSDQDSGTGNNQSSTVLRKINKEPIELTVQTFPYPDKMPDGSPFPSPVGPDCKATGADTPQPHRAQYPEFEAPLRKIQIPQSGWTAVVFENVKDANGKDTKGREVTRIPLTFLMAGLLESDNKIFGMVPSITLSFETKELDFGQYWVDLENSVEFQGISQPCKTVTPSIRLDIVKNELPTVDLKIAPGCYIRATANATDKNNMSFHADNRQQLTLKWTVRNDKGVDIPFKVSKKSGDPNSFRYGEEIVVEEELSPGKYYISATVSDGVDEAIDSGEQTIEPSCLHTDPVRGAGIVYFNFDVPYLPRTTDNDPDYWIVRRPQDVGKKGSNDALPKKEYEPFYLKYLNYEGKYEVPLGVRSNSDKLKDIVKQIRDGYSKFPGTFHLYVIGYTDDNEIKECHNYQLAEARIAVVKNYLIEGLKEKDAMVNWNDVILSNIRSINRAAVRGKYRYPNNWADQRKLDRRAELIFSFENKVPDMDGYAVPPCVPKEKKMK
jgi:hypothetical protein